MSASRILTALVILSAATSSYACDGIWQPNTAGNWSTGFSPCTPTAVLDSATFGTPPAGPVAVNVDTMPTITAINFQNVNSYTIAGNPIALQGVAPGDPSSIQVLQGNHTINSQVNLNNNTALTVTTAAGTSLQIKNLTDMITAASITLNGPGEVTCINDGPTNQTEIFIGGDLTVNGTTLRAANTAALTDGFGVGFQANNFTINNASASFINSGDITFTQMAGQVFGLFVPFTGNLTINNGNLDIVNTGNITSTFSTGAALGVLSEVIGTVNLNSGALRVLNTGTFDANSQGAALLSLMGINVNGGIFINNGLVTAGLAPTVTVGTQGTLAGNGLFVLGGGNPFLPTIILNSGRLMPGDPDRLGTMQILGQLIQFPTATFQANIRNGNNYGRLTSSTVNLDGSLGVFGMPGLQIRPGDRFTIIDTTDGITGTFSSVSMLNNSSYIPMVFYSPTQVILALNAGSFPGIQQSLFTSINNTNIRLERELQHIRSRFGEEVPPDSRAAKSSSYRLSNQRLAVIPIASQMQIQREQERLGQSVKYCVDRPFNLYFGPIGTIGDYNTKRHQVGFSEWSAGALLGLDYAGDGIGVGLQVEYEREHGHVHKQWGHFNVDQAHADLFATYVPSGAPKLAINGIIGGGYDWIRVHRKTGLTGSDTATGSPHASEFDALFGLEYTIDVKKTGGGCSNIKFIPMVNLQYIYLNIDGYREHSAGIFDLSISGQKPQSLRSTLGAWITDFWEWTDSRLDLTLDLAWQREYLDHGKRLHFATPNFAAPAGSMTAVGAGRNSLLVGLDLLYTIDDKYGIEGSYDYQWNNLFTDNSFYLGFNVKF